MERQGLSMFVGGELTAVNNAEISPPPPSPCHLYRASLSFQ